MNKFAENFIGESEENRDLYEKSYLLKDTGAQNQLKSEFNDYLFKMYLCSYIKKTIYFSSSKIMQKKGYIREHEKLVLDNSDSGEPIVLEKSKTDIFSEMCENQPDIRQMLEFCDEKLEAAFDRLTEKEKYVVSECIINDRAQSEIALKLNVTRQAVNKIKRSAIKKLNAGIGGSAYES